MRVYLSATSCRVINCQSLFPAERRQDVRLCNQTHHTLENNVKVAPYKTEENETILLFKQIAHNCVWEPPCFPPWVLAIALVLPTWRCRENSLPTRTSPTGILPRSTAVHWTGHDQNGAQNETCLKEGCTQKNVLKCYMLLKRRFLGCWGYVQMCQRPW